MTTALHARVADGVIAAYIREIAGPPPGTSRPGGPRPQPVPELPAAAAWTTVGRRDARSRRRSLRRPTLSAAATGR